MVVSCQFEPSAARQAVIHKIIAFRRIALQGFRNFFRNAWLSVAATAVMVVTLTIILSSAALNMILSDNIKDIASRVTVSIYLKDGSTPERKSELEQSLNNSFNVKTVRFISKDEAFAIFLEQNANDPTIISGATITDNVLPESFEVEVEDLSQIDAVTAVAEDERFRDVVDETSVNEQRKQSIDNIAKAQDYINLASVILVGIFAGISTLIIFNTIRMAVFTRSDEIEIMKLIGATPGYIRGPFLFEAALYGVFAGVLASVGVYSALLSLGPRADQALLVNQTVDFFAGHWFLILLGTISIGILIGL
ncbi:MAG TPA: permease-like cell division protein FtsX, partial [Candidatus Saccharimonadales bacterium]